jgi:hypothetical protein
MKVKKFIARFVLGTMFTLIFPLTLSAAETEAVTAFNFTRAETDNYISKYVEQGAFGKFIHFRAPVAIDRQAVIRMQRDTLYSIGVFDLTEPLTIVKPDAGKRFMSMLIINEDHSMLPVIHESGEFAFTREQVGTRYVTIIVRTFINSTSESDIKEANEIQDKIIARQKSQGSFHVPNWDQASLKKVRDALNILAADLPNARGCFGDKSKIDSLRFVLCTAYGWGGNPDEGAIYNNVVPAENDGKTPYSVTVKDVPVDGFWSITVYNKDGFMQKNDQDAYSFNNVNAKPNPDGSITINFGGGENAVNNLPITPGWNYIVRMYQPGEEILNDSWQFPLAEPVK